MPNGAEQSQQSASSFGDVIKEYYMAQKSKKHTKKSSRTWFP